MGMVWAVAGGIGPVLGGVFTSRVTWRWCFWVNLPISGVGFAILCFALKLHNPRTPIGPGLAAVDWLGSLTVIGGTLMVLMGLEFGNVEFPWDSPTVICLIVFGLVTVAVFVLIEWKVAKYPLMPLQLFKRRSNLAALGVSFFHGLTFIGGTYYLPLYFQAVLGASPLLSGVYVLPFTLSLAFTSAATGVFMKKTGKYLPPIWFGMVCMTLGFGLFVNLQTRADWARVVLFQIVAGIGVGCQFQPPLIALQATVEPRDIASATGTFGFARQLATSMSVVFGGVVFQNSMQKQYPALLAELGQDTASLLTGASAGANVAEVAALQGSAGDIARAAYWNSMKDMFIMYAAFSATGLVVSLFVRARHLSREHQEHKTGLDTMQTRASERKARDQERGASTKDEERGPHADGAKEAQQLNTAVAT
jgi:MFS family permease